MNSNNEVKIKGDGMNGGNLFSSLNPLRRMTHCTGIFLDWHYRPTEKNTSYFDNFVVFCLRVTYLALVSITFYACFEVWQTIQAVLSPSWRVIEELVLYFVMMIPFVQAFFTSIFFLNRRKELLNFLESFYLLETEFCIPSSHVKKSRLIAYFIYGIAMLFTFVGVCFVIMQPSYVVNGTVVYLPYYLNYYEIFRDNISEQLLEMFHIWSFAGISIPYLLSDLVPSFVYYHSGVVLKSIATEMEHMLLLNTATSAAAVMDPDGRKIHHIWAIYDRLANLVRRANEMFGYMLLLDYGIKFFLVSLLVHSVLATMRNQDDLAFTIVHLAAAICIATRLIMGVLLKSYLYQSSKTLSNQITSLTNRHWFCMNKNQRKLLLMFQKDVDRDQLIANPLDLFYITPGLLLAMLSLTVTYVIILFQS